jgi:hypothetical protein
MKELTWSCLCKSPFNLGEDLHIISRIQKHPHLLSATLLIYTLLQLMILFTRKSGKKGPHLDMRQKYHHVNLDKLIWTYPM